MKKTFIQSGNTVRVRDNHSMSAHPDLPAATYTVKYDERGGEFFLEMIEDFELPAKIYGRNTNYAERVLGTFNDRSGTTGVLLSGIKGAGKTLLAKQISVAAKQQGISTIVINRDWHGDEFNSFIQSINTPSIVMFDEFEKIYGYHEQRKILTLLDGVFNSRKLFLLTTNTQHDVSEFLRNRPGRIYYNFEFDTLGQDFIEEYLEDRLNDKRQIPDILKYTKVFSFFNFDMLSAAVEEMNRYSESLAEVLEVLNIKPENKRTDTFRIELILGERKFLLDRDFTNFQPNSFEYIIWGDRDMPDELKKDDFAKKYISEFFGPKKSATGGGDPTDILTSAHDIFDEDLSINFNTGKIKRFDQADNRFVYSVERNGREIEMHVTRNDMAAKWSFNPNAF